MVVSNQQLGSTGCSWMDQHLQRTCDRTRRDVRLRQPDRELGGQLGFVARSTHRYLEGSGREVAQVMGYSERWVTEIVRRYDEDGLAGLADRRHGNAGAKPCSTPPSARSWSRRFKARRRRAGLWTGPKVAAAATGQEIHPQWGCDYLQELGFTLKHPRPRHGKADAAAQAAFKKGAAGAAGRATGGAPQGGVRAVPRT